MSRHQGCYGIRTNPTPRSLFIPKHCQYFCKRRRYHFPACCITNTSCEMGVLSGICQATSWGSGSRSAGLPAAFLSGLAENPSSKASISTHIQLKKPTQETQGGGKGQSSRLQETSKSVLWLLWMASSWCPQQWWNCTQTGSPAVTGGYWCQPNSAKNSFLLKLCDFVFP